MTFRTPAVSIAAVALMAGQAAAQEFSSENASVEAGLSTLGAYVAPGYSVTDSFSLRVPVYLGGYSDTFDLDDNDVEGDLDVTAAHVMADYYIAGTGFRVSGGLSFGGYNIEADADTLTFDGEDYDGPFNLTLEQERSVSAVVSLGYKRMFSERWGFSTEVGARISSFELTATGQENIPNDTGDRDDFNAEIAEINEDLEDIGAIPFISLGVAFDF